MVFAGLGEPGAAQWLLTFRVMFSKYRIWTVELVQAT